MGKDAALNLPEGIIDSKKLASMIESKSVYREIGKLIQDNRITRLGRGQYIAGSKAKYDYTPSEDLKKVEKVIRRQFSDLDFRIGEAYQLNWFVNHQISRNVVVVDVEKMLTESVFFTLREKFHTLLRPGMKEMANYIQDGTVIVQNLVSGSPSAKDNNIAPLEKLLVDIVCDKKYLNFIQKSEFSGIYENAFASYNINRAAMLRYAGRRSCREEVESLMENL